MNPKLRFHNGPIGWGVYAMSPVFKGETIIHVKREDQLTLEDMVRTLEGAINVEGLSQIGLRPDCLDLLTWTILLEQDKGDTSDFAEYISILPNNYDSGQLNLEL